MQMKRTLKALGFVVALAAAFVAGLIWISMREFATSLGGPHIQSDYLVQERIKGILPALPGTAHHLYYAIKGFQDSDTFIACSVPEDDFSSLVTQVRELARQRGHGTHPHTQDPIRHGPDSWPDEHKNPRWDLSLYSDIVTESTNRVTTMYSPGGHRVFVFLWGN